MKLTKQTRTKLDLIRLEGLRKLLLEKYDNETLINKIVTITKSNPKDAKAIEKLPRYQLIKIIELGNITDEDINEKYEEYRYGQKPGFAIFSFKSGNKKLTQKTLETKIKEELNKIPYNEEEQPTIKDIKYTVYEEFKDYNLTEFTFYYSKKYSYINEKEEPTYIYELKETFVWVSTEYNFIAIKNCDERVIRKLSSIFSIIYGAELCPIVLTKVLVEKIFGNRQKKVSGINLNATEKEAEKLMISDSKLNEKKDLIEQLKDYTFTSEILEINVNDVLNNLGVNNSKGKIHLTRNASATIFRNWSVTTIKKIIEYIANNETEYEIFKAKNIMNNTYWDSYTAEQKRLIQEIIFKIINFSKDGYTPVLTTNINYAKFSKYFYNRVFVSCLECNDNSCIPKCECNSYNLKLTRNNTIICNECGSILNYLYCEEDHKINITNLENISVYLLPTEELFNDIITFIKETLNISFNGHFIIVNNNIEIIENSIGKLLKASEISEFSEINNIVIEKDERLRLAESLKSINEKCTSSTKEKCNNCNNYEDICIMKMFTTFEDYRPRPHQGHEFGDINFKVTYDNKKLEFVGIAKSYCNLTRSGKESREMKDQILIATQDKRINIIGAICPSRFDPQLEKDIEYIAKCTQSKVVILDDEFMVKQLKNYSLSSKK